MVLDVRSSSPRACCQRTSPLSGSSPTIAPVPMATICRLPARVITAGDWYRTLASPWAQILSPVPLSSPTMARPSEPPICTTSRSSITSGVVANPKSAGSAPYSSLSCFFQTSAPSASFSANIRPSEARA